MPTITSSIGTSARDYATITLWEADLDDGGIYSALDDAVGELYADTDFDEEPVIDGGGIVGLASVRLTCAAGHEHDGTAGSGVALTLTSKASNYVIYGTINNLTIEDFEVDCGAIGSGTQYGVRLDGGDECIIRRMIVHNIDMTGLVTGVTIHTNTAGNNCSINNCIVYNLDANTGFACYGVGNNRSDSVENFIYNNTVHNIEISASNDAGDKCYGYYNTGSNAAKEFINNIATSVVITGTGTDNLCYSTDVSTESYNISDDASAAGTGSITSVAAADLYVSTVGGSEDLHLKPEASDAIDAGTDLGTQSGCNVDINGRDRDAELDTWDIGAHEYFAAISPVSSDSVVNYSLLLDLFSDGQINTANVSGGTPRKYWTLNIRDMIWQTNVRRTI